MSQIVILLLFSLIQQTDDFHVAFIRPQNDPQFIQIGVLIGFYSFHPGST